MLMTRFVYLLSTSLAKENPENSYIFFNFWFQMRSILHRKRNQRYISQRRLGHLPG